MKKLVLSSIFIFFILISVIPASYSWIPPTPAFQKIHTDNGTVFAKNYTMPVIIQGINGITVNGNNSTHTIIFSDDNCVDTYQAQNIGTGDASIYAGFTTSGSTSCAYASANIGTGDASIYAGKTP